MALLSPPLLTDDQLLLNFTLRPKLARPVFIKKYRLVDTRRPRRRGELRLVSCEVERHLQLLEGGRVLISVIERTEGRLAPLPVGWHCTRGDELWFIFGFVVLFGQCRIKV